MKNKLFLLVVIATTQLNASQKQEFNTFEIASLNIARNKNACCQCRSLARASLVAAIQNKYKNTDQLLKDLPNFEELERDAKARKAPFNNPTPPCCLAGCQKKAEAFGKRMEKK